MTRLSSSTNPGNVRPIQALLVIVVRVTTDNPITPTASAPSANARCAPGVIGKACDICARAASLACPSRGAPMSLGGARRGDDEPAGLAEVDGPPAQQRGRRGGEAANGKRVAESN